MSLTTFDATPQKPEASTKEQNVLAQALTGDVYGNGDNALASFAKGGSQALQQTLDRNAKDLEAQGALPESKNVANVEDATPADKSADFQTMMANDTANTAMNNALQNVENKEA